MNQKRFLKNQSLFFLFFLNSFLYPDSFTNIIQDLAMQTACIGQYSATQAGGGWNEDPHDYYTPKMMAERFKKMSGDMTRTTTFYGVCFDYAQFAWDDIKKYQSSYNNAGMKNQEWYLVYVGDDSNVLTLEDPVSAEKSDVIHNGINLKRKDVKNIKAHKGTNGVRATRHEWLWIQRNDGTWFWIDPTWTDNLGYVVYGYVANGEEIQLRPDKKFCIIYPDYLNNLPLPPEAKKAPQQEQPKPKPQPEQGKPPELEEQEDEILPIEKNNNNTTDFGMGFGLCFNNKGQYSGILWDFIFRDSSSIIPYSAVRWDFIHVPNYGFAGIGVGLDSGLTSKYIDVFLGGAMGFKWIDPYVSSKIDVGIQLNLSIMMIKVSLIYDTTYILFDTEKPDAPLQFALTLALH